MYPLRMVIIFSLQLREHKWDITAYFAKSAVKSPLKYPFFQFFKTYCVFSQNLKSAAYFWPGSEAVIKNLRPTYWKVFNDSVPYRTRVDEVGKKSVLLLAFWAIKTYSEKVHRTFCIYAESLNLKRKFALWIILISFIGYWMVDYGIRCWSAPDCVIVFR